MLATETAFLVPDFELKLFIDAAANLMPAWSPDDLAVAEAYVRDRSEMVRAGVRRCPPWFQEELHRVDSLLRCWWDAWNNEWVIDRFQDEGIIEGLLRLAETESADVKQSLRDSASGLLEKGYYYLTIMHFAPRDELQLNRALLDMLRSMDMQRSSPAQIIDDKRRRAAAVAKSNERAGDDKVLEKVDELSDKQVKEFIDVTRALYTGETLVAHGEAAKVMEDIAEARKKGPPLPIKKLPITKSWRKGYR